MEGGGQRAEVGSHGADGGTMTKHRSPDSKRQTPGCQHQAQSPEP